MHTIQIPDAKFKELSEQVTAAGFEDVVAYIEALAKEADFDPRCGMSDEELRQSAAQCNSINERMKAGAERNAREALTELGDKFGFSKSLMEKYRVTISDDALAGVEDYLN